MVLYTWGSIATAMTDETQTVEMRHTETRICVFCSDTDACLRFPLQFCTESSFAPATPCAAGCITTFPHFSSFLPFAPADLSHLPPYATSCTTLSLHSSSFQCKIEALLVLSLFSHTKYPPHTSNAPHPLHLPRCRRYLPSSFLRLAPTHRSSYTHLLRLPPTQS